MGVSNYMGDLASGHVEKEEYKLAYGILGRYNYGNYLSFRASISKASVSGSDGLSDERSGRRQRNLSFQSDIYEGALMAEFNIFGYDALENHTQFTPYIFAGLAGFYYNPQGYYENEWIDLQPLGTEGQGMPGYGEKYKRFKMSVPMGMGLKVSISEAVNFGMEVGIRRTNTDYLDDVSTNYPDLQLLQEEGDLRASILSYRTPEYDPTASNRNPEGLKRGNPDGNDWYMMSGVTLTINLGVGSHSYGPRPHARPWF